MCREMACAIIELYLPESHVLDLLFPFLPSLWAFLQCTHRQAFTTTPPNQKQDTSHKLLNLIVIDHEIHLCIALHKVSNIREGRQRMQETMDDRGLYCVCGSDTIQNCAFCKGRNITFFMLMLLFTLKELFLKSFNILHAVAVKIKGKKQFHPAFYSLVGRNTCVCALHHV